MACVGGFHALGPVDSHREFLDADARGLRGCRDGACSKAIITDFFAAAFNPQTIPTYLHTVLALLIFGAFIAMAIAAYYHIKGRNPEFVTKMMRWGAIVTLVCMVLMMPVAHMQAQVVADEQPTKLAAMEGQYETEPVPMYLVRHRRYRERYGHWPLDSGSDLVPRRG